MKLMPAILPILLTLICHRTASAYYDPGIQRWISRDPIGEEGGANLTGFLANDPASRIDPSGLKARPSLPIQLGWACGCWVMAHSEADKAQEWANATIGSLGMMHENEGSPADMLTHCVGACEIAKKEGVCLIAGINIRRKVLERERNLNRGGDRMDYENDRIGFAIADAGMDCKQGCVQAFAQGWLWTIDRTPPYKAHPARRPSAPTPAPPKPQPR
jgi:hypothetical protein